MRSIKEIIQHATPWDSHGNEKNVISISIAFSINILIRNENIISEERKTKNRLK